MEKDGLITFTVQSTEAAGKPSEGELSKRMVEILGKINDPSQPVSEINRLIAGEIAVVTGEMSMGSQANMYKQKLYTEQIRSLRYLSKTLSESELLSKKDFLNFDGPKFQFVFQELAGAVRKSAKDSGFSEDQTNTLLRNFRDTVTQMEPELRKQTEKIDSSFLQR